MTLSPGLDLPKTPLMPNPSGAPPDFQSGPSLQDDLFSSGVALLVISAMFLTIRLATNVKVAQKLCLDDLLCIFAFAGGAGYWGLNLYIAQRGATKHAWDIPLSFMSESMAKTQVAVLVLIAPTIWAAKSAILALYIRVFGSVQWLRRTAYVWILFMALFYSMNIAVAGAYCIPRKGEAWGGASFTRCAINTWPHIVIGVFSCFADLLILILPFPIVMSLHISFMRKVTLGFVFGTGTILVLLSIVSLYLRVLVYRGHDPTWNAALLVSICVAEIFGTVIVSCAPAISSFWHNIFIHSTAWSRIQSSVIFSSLKSRFPRQSSANLRPSFVFSSPSSRPMEYSQKQTSQND